MRRARSRSPGRARLFAGLALTLSAACSSQSTPGPVAKATPAAVSVAPTGVERAALSTAPAAELATPRAPGPTGQLLLPPIDSDPSADPLHPSLCRAGAKTVVGQADGNMSEVTIAATRLGVMAAWADRPPDPTTPFLPTGEGALHVQPLTPSGAPKGASVEIAQWSSPSLKLFALDDGTFLLAYNNCCGGYSKDAYLLHLDASGAALGAKVERPVPGDIVDVSSSGGLIAAVVDDYDAASKASRHALLRIDTSREPMRVVAEDLPDTTSVSSRLRSDGRVWLVTSSSYTDVHVRLLGGLSSEPAVNVALPNSGSLSLGPNGDLVVVDDGLVVGPEANAWRLRAGDASPTSFKVPSAERLGRARLPIVPGADGVSLLSFGPGPDLTLAREHRLFWRADSTWQGTTYIAIYVDVGFGQRRNVVVQSVTCTKPKAK